MDGHVVLSVRQLGDGARPARRPRDRAGVLRRGSISTRVAPAPARRARSHSTGSAPRGRHRRQARRSPGARHNLRGADRPHDRFQRLRPRRRGLIEVPKIVLGAEPLVDAPTALRPWRDSDIYSIVAACQDPEIVRWTRVPEHVRRGRRPRLPAAALTNRPMPAPRRRSRSSPRTTSTTCSDRSR